MDILIPNAKLDIAKNAAQLNQSLILVEQLLCMPESILLMMSLDAFPTLNLEGVGVASDMQK